MTADRELFLLGLCGFFVWLSPFFVWAAGGGKILSSSWHQPVNVFVLFRDGLAQFFVRAGLSRFPGCLLAVFCWRGGDRELFR